MDDKYAITATLIITVTDPEVTFADNNAFAQRALENRATVNLWNTTFYRSNFLASQQS